MDIVRTFSKRQTSYDIDERGCRKNMCKEPTQPTDLTNDIFQHFSYVAWHGGIVTRTMDLVKSRSRENLWDYDYIAASVKMQGFDFSQ